MLEIRTYRSKPDKLRIDIFRKYKSIHPTTEKVSYRYKQLGSFNYAEPCPLELMALLDNEESMQLSNWLAETKFSDKQHTPIEATRKISLHIPENLYQALVQLTLEAKRIGMAFAPSQIMLDSLLQKSAIVEKKIEKMNGFSNPILEKAGVVLADQPNTLTEKQATASQDRELFKRLLQLNQSIGKTCGQLEQAANQFNKVKRIPPPQLEEWAGVIPSRNPNKPIHFWCYAIAIEVLQRNHINPMTIIPLERVAHYWISQRKETLPLKEAVNQFLKQFDVPSAKKAAVEDIFTAAYQKMI